MDLHDLKNVDTFALQLLGAAATTSMAVRVIIVIFIDDIYEIVERYRKWKRTEKQKEKEIEKEREEL